jgi:hypothetical protein
MASAETATMPGPLVSGDLGCVQKFDQALPVLVERERLGIEPFKKARTAKLETALAHERGRESAHLRNYLVEYCEKPPKILRLYRTCPAFFWFTRSL